MEEKDLVQEVSLPIFQSKGWMKFLGVMLIIDGVISIFTVVGILWCWLLIWLGVLIFKAASFIEVAQLNGDKVQLVESLKRIKTFFVINGVLLLVGLIFMAIMMIIAGGSMMSLMNSF